jgi:uncharacterized protein YkwD
MARVRMLAVALFSVAALLLPAATASASSPAGAMIAKVNQWRHNRGLPPLHASSSLNRSAQSYASHMMHAGYFGHAGRIHASRRFKTLGEIIEMHRGSRSDLSGALRAWAGSPGHRAILVDGRFSFVGAGKATGRYHGRTMTFWVMHFGRK